MQTAIVVFDNNVELAQDFSSDSAHTEAFLQSMVRYLLRFEPKNPHPGLHQVRVRLRERGDAFIIARRSYWVQVPTDVSEDSHR